MQYLGGKARIAKQIASVIGANSLGRKLCIEPFMGGCNVTIQLAQIFDQVHAYDFRLDLVLMRQALANGWIPPQNLTEEEYKILKTSEPSALRGFIGAGCSFGGKWFGGYARNKKQDNYVARSARVVQKETILMPNVRFQQGNFFDIPIVPDAVLYCDPPYILTTGYSLGKFDHVRFWERTREWANSGALVFVSEQIAPDDFVSIWAKTKTKGLRAASGKHEMLQEHLFVMKQQPTCEVK